MQITLFFFSLQKINKSSRLNFRPGTALEYHHLAVRKQLRFGPDSWRSQKPGHAPCSHDAQRNRRAPKLNPS